MGAQNTIHSSRRSDLLWFLHKAYHNDRDPRKRLRFFLLSWEKNVLFSAEIGETKTDEWLDDWKNGYDLIIIAGSECEMIEESSSFIVVRPFSAMGWQYLSTDGG